MGFYTGGCAAAAQICRPSILATEECPLTAKKNSPSKFDSLRAETIRLVTWVFQLLLAALRHFLPSYPTLEVRVAPCTVGGWWGNLLVEKKPPRGQSGLEGPAVQAKGPRVFSIIPRGVRE